MKLSLTQRGQNETKSNVNKRNEKVFIKQEKRFGFTWWKDTKEISMIKIRALYYIFETSVKNYKVA